MKNQIVECHYCGHDNIIEFDKESEEIAFTCYGCREILEYDIEAIIEYRLIPKEFNYIHCINCGDKVLKSSFKKRKYRGEIFDKFCLTCYNKALQESM